MCHSSRMALRKHDCRAIARGHNARVVRPFRSPAGAPQGYRVHEEPGREDMGQVHTRLSTPASGLGLLGSDTEIDTDRCTRRFAQVDA